jgi:la-related protein 1
MIASFNRIKSLTPDVAIVKEVMSVSSLLEVREEKVRLAGSEAQRWVLPDAKPSPWASSDPKSPAQVTSPHVHPHDPAFGVEEIPPAPKFVAADVENALMKSSAAAAAVAVAATSVTSDSTVAGTTATTVTSVPPSSSASLLNGDESVDKDTPATSTNGDHEGEVKAE